MRISRAGVFIVTMILAVTLPGPAAPHASAFEATQRLVDGDGVVHLTNVPADPRYRGLPGATSSAPGWLRLPTRALPPYAAEVQEIARAHGVSPALITAMMRAESRFDPAAMSPKGAGGLMQLMPATAVALGVTDRFNARESISGGVRHLRYLLDRYQGSVVLALAAYNAGEAVVDAHRGVPPYPETQQYVRRVLRETGLNESTPGTVRTIYRYPSSDDTLTYSNLPPPPRRGKERLR